MKRRFVIGLAFATIVSAITFISYKYLEKQRNDKRYLTMPDFSFRNIQNQIQKTSMLPKFDGYVIQVFNPDCGICITEANDYLNHNNSMQHILFLMLSADSIRNIKEFALKTQLYNTDNFVFGHLRMATFELLFGSANNYSIFIYDSGKNFIRKERVANAEMILNCFIKPEY